MKGETAQPEDPEYGYRTPDRMSAFGIKTVKLGDEKNPHHIGTFIAAETNKVHPAFRPPEDPRLFLGKYDVEQIDFKLVPDTEYSRDPDNYLTLDFDRNTVFHTPETFHHPLVYAVSEGEENYKEKMDLEEKYGDKAHEKDEPGDKK
jgi:hypothetical protein